MEPMHFTAWRLSHPGNETAARRHRIELMNARQAENRRRSPWRRRGRRGRCPEA